jgi:hypothetical protein
MVHANLQKFCDIPDMTCIDDTGAVIGTFDGEIIVNSERRKFSVSNFSISCVALLNDDHTCLVGDRGGTLFVVDIRNGVRIAKYDIGVLGVQITPISRGEYVVYSGEKIFSCTKNIHEPLTLRKIHTGYPGIIRSVVVAGDVADGLRLYCLVGDGDFILGMSLARPVAATCNASNAHAQYTRKVLLDRATIFCQSGDNMYVIGSIPRIGQRALGHIRVDESLIGALESPENFKLESVLAFDESKEEPICIGLWTAKSCSIVAVGTSGRGNRGRLILFDTSSMVPICKTYVPSKQVTVVEELGPELLAIGCMDCVVLVGLVCDDDQINLVTMGVFQTYIQVKHINRVDNTRFLLVLQNGQIMLCGIKGDEILVLANPDLQRHVVSACVLIPPKRDTFICSTIDGDLVQFSIDGANESGVMTTIHQSKTGIRITAFTNDSEYAILGFSNGSIIQISSSIDN